MNALEGNPVNYNAGTGVTALSGREVSESMAYDNALYGIIISTGRRSGGRPGRAGLAAGRRRSPLRVPS